ncbi:hypothetical protein BSNK01_26490 [Bacillaceae bacterium]
MKRRSGIILSLVLAFFLSACNGGTGEKAMDNGNNMANRYPGDGRYGPMNNDAFDTGTNDGFGPRSIYRDRGAGTAAIRGNIGDNPARNNFDAFGYVTYDRRQLQREGRNGAIGSVIVDRTALAKVIGHTVGTINGVERVHVLVTDEEVFVGYRTNVNEASRKERLDRQVRHSALSLSPRYYHVYVSSHPKIVERIARAGNISPNGMDRDDHAEINRLAREIGGTAAGMGEEFVNRKANPVK